MISYTMVGTRDIKKAGTFFDKVLGLLGAGRAMEFDSSIVWATAPDKPMFAVCLPHNGKEATVGNGTMISFSANSQDQVKDVYAAALANGGTSEGEPGPRGEGGYYMAYFRDPDGNKFALFHHMG